MTYAPSLCVYEPAPSERLAPFTTIHCHRLHGTLPARCCVLRQSRAARGRTLQGSRGQGVDFPSCWACPQGDEVREQLDGADLYVWRGAGPGHRFDAGSPRHEVQVLARARLAAVGLLDLAPTLDEPPGDVGEADAAG